MTDSTNPHDRRHVPYVSSEAVLALNQELRKDGNNARALPDQSGHVAFQMSAADYMYWTLRYPDLAASDSQIARQAWAKFLRSDDGRKYTINPNEARKTRRTGVIIK